MTFEKLAPRLPAEDGSHPLGAEDQLRQHTPAVELSNGAPEGARHYREDIERLDVYTSLVGADHDAALSEIYFCQHQLRVARANGGGDEPVSLKLRARSHRDGHGWVRVAGELSHATS